MRVFGVEISWWDVQGDKDSEEEEDNEDEDDTNANAVKNREKQEGGMSSHQG